MVPDSWDIELREAAFATCRALLRVGAITFDEAHPFTVGTGLVSPIHINCRRVLSFPHERSLIVELAVRMIEHEIGEGVIEAIAAGEGAGLPFATLIAYRMNLPMVYVRKDPPSDPHKRRIEGAVRPGQRVLLVEQLATDGHRKARFAQPLREVGARLEDAFVLFQYGIFDTIHENLAPLGITLHALASWWDLYEVAQREHTLDERILSELHAFLHDPVRWSGKSRGGAPAVA